MLKTFGGLTVALGIMAADSRCLLFPVAIIAVGIVMVILGEEVKER